MRRHPNEYVPGPPRSVCATSLKACLKARHATRDADKATDLRFEFEAPDQFDQSSFLLVPTYVARTIAKMKETVLQNAPKVMYVYSCFCVSQSKRVDGASSKKLQFSTLTAQDVVRISEFQVTHRDLYTTTDRAPVKDGVLDRRLVSSSPSTCSTRCGLCSSRVRQKRMHSVKPAGSMLSTASVITPISNLSSLSFTSVISSTRSPSFSAYVKYVFIYHQWFPSSLPLDMRPCAAGRARKTNVSQKVPPPEPR